jgi:hypothetical protein
VSPCACGSNPCKSEAASYFEDALALHAALFQARAGQLN